jgi:hypothetical protein
VCVLAISYKNVKYFVIFTGLNGSRQQKKKKKKKEKNPRLQENVKLFFCNLENVSHQRRNTYFIALYISASSRSLPQQTDTTSLDSSR